MKITLNEGSVPNHWDDNRIQYPRLIAEIVACVNFTLQDFERLQDSMDLSRNEIIELIERAQSEWNKIKTGEITFINITKGLNHENHN